MIVARVDRMKEAKTEAEQIIAAYRAEMEAAYKSKADSVRILSFYVVDPFLYMIYNSPFSLSVLSLILSFSINCCFFPSYSSISKRVLVDP